MQKIRAFIAVTLPETVVKSIHSVQVILQNDLPGVRLVKSELLHLTLHFFGQVDEDKAKIVIDRIKQRIETSKIAIEFKELGGFPTKKRARVVWIGIDSPGLTELANVVRDSVVSVGLPIENRPFFPHLTIARAKKSPVDMSQIHITPDIQECFSDTLVLFRSDLTPHGPIYTPLKVIQS